LDPDDRCDILYKQRKKMRYKGKVRFLSPKGGGEKKDRGQFERLEKKHREGVGMMVGGKRGKRITHGGWRRQRTVFACMAPNCVQDQSLFWEVKGQRGGSLWRNL